MKITKLGIVPPPQLIAAICKNCKTEFNYQEKDILTRKHKRDIIVCPLCDTMQRRIRW